MQHDWLRQYIAKHDNPYLNTVVARFKLPATTLGPVKKIGVHKIWHNLLPANLESLTQQ